MSNESLINNGKAPKYGRGEHPNSLANLKRIPKGQSGNPKGRPPKDYSIISLIKEMLDLPADMPVPGADGVKTWRQLIARAIVYGAAKGNTQMINELLNRLEGKPTQPTEGEVTLKVLYENDGDSSKES